MKHTGSENIQTYHIKIVVFLIQQQILVTNLHKNM